MITIKNLTYSYDDKKIILDDINVSIDDGKIMGLVGINGAGKSTLLRLLTGVYLPKSGEIYIDAKKPSDEDLRKDIFFLSDDPFYTNDTTCKSLRKLLKTFYKDFNDEVYEEIMNLFKLPANKKIRTFSKGMRRQAYIALAFAIGPKYLFLDEAFDGLDPLAKIRFKNYIYRIIKEKGSTVLISSHSLAELSDFCDEYLMIDGNKIVHTGLETGEESKFSKFQIAFSDIKTKEDFSNFELVEFKAVGHVVTVILKDNKEDAIAKINSMNPLVVDELKLNFEEAFFQTIDSEMKGGEA